MERQVKLGWIVNIIFAILILVADICFIVIDCSPYITKTIASILFVLCGAYNLFYCLYVLKIRKNLSFMWLMFLGLVLAMLGDILLIDYFVVGAILFGTGHVFFFLSFCMISGFSIRDLIIGAIIFVLAFLLIEFYSNFDFGGMKILVIVYALIISLMMGKALSNMFCKNNLLIYSVILLGAGLFFISDLMLMFYLFAGRAVVFDIICLATYYPAEFILALSIYLVANKLMSTSKNFRK